MNQDSEDTTRRSASLSTFLAAVLGGLVVLIAGAVLIATGVIDTGKDRTIVKQTTLSPSASNAKTSDEGDRGGRTVQDIYREEGKGVVFIQSDGVSEGTSIFGEQQQGTATGSGFLVDDKGTILTNAHVVQGASSVSVKFEEDGDPIDAEVKGTDTSTDVAVLKIDPKKAEGKALPLGRSATAQVGDPVIAIGNPFGFTRTVTTGIVSALAREIRAPNGFQIDHVIQTDAAINPGNSGGPLLDADGRVIGITSQIATGGSGSGSIGIGFAIPIDTIKKLLPQLESRGEVTHAYLGVTMADVDSKLAQDLNLPVKEGALIQEVKSGGPAAKAGLHGGRTTTSDGLKLGGDLIAAVDGKRTPSSQAVSDAVARKQPGDTVEIEYYRGGDKHSVKVKLGKRPNNLESQGDQQQSPNGGGDTPFPLP
jgi:S1-C subfamily serine protease